MATISSRLDADENIIGWQARVRKKGYPQQIKTFRSKTNAEGWARKVESEMERGIWRDTSESERTTLGEALGRYADTVTIRKKNHAPELARIRQWQRRSVAELSLARFGGKELADVVGDMEVEGKSPNTIRLHLAVLSHLFKVARTEWGMTSLVNPVELVRKPKLPQGRDRRLVGDEEPRLLTVCKESGNPWLLPAVRFAIETAMRAGEILETRGKADKNGERLIQTEGLLWKHVDLNRQIALLPQTKNGTARTVPLSTTAVSILNGIPRSLDGKVFGTTYESIHSAFVQTCKQAGIEGLRFHDLRHEATSRFFEKGLNPMQVAAITGHKTLQMLKRYTHLRAEDLAKMLG